MDNRGMELSVNVIVIAVIALLVLLVVIAVFSGQIGSFTTGVKDCTSKGGSCVNEGDNCPSGYTQFFGSGVCEEGQKCCVIVGSGCIAKKGVSAENALLCLTRNKEDCHTDCKWVE